MKAIEIAANGGSEVMKLTDQATPSPKDGELLVKVDAIGVNFIDTYQRSGLYKVPLPFVPGQEAAGVVEKVGGGVSGFAVGDKVVFNGILGSYAEFQTAPAERVVKVPGDLDTKQAAAVMLQGMTAHYLCFDTFQIRPGHRCLIHAGAGGVGLLLTQLCKMLGAEVISTVSTEEKAKLAKGAGADHVILYSKDDFEAETLRITGGTKLDVVYDSVAASTFEKGLKLLKPRGLMALYGNASGPVPPYQLNGLNPAGSLYVTRPSLGFYTATRDDLVQRAGHVLDLVRLGKLNVRIGHEYSLADAKQAHDDLEGRKTTGKLILVP